MIMSDDDLPFHDVLGVGDITDSEMSEGVLSDNMADTPSDTNMVVSTSDALVSTSDALVSTSDAVVSTSDAVVSTSDAVVSTSDAAMVNTTYYATGAADDGVSATESTSNSQVSTSETNITTTEVSQSEIASLRSLLQSQQKTIKCLTTQIESFQTWSHVDQVQPGPSSWNNRRSSRNPVNNHFTSIKRSKVMEIDFDLSQIKDIKSETGGINLLFHTGWNIESLPSLPLSPISMGSIGTWCSENALFDCTSIPKRVTDSIRRGVDEIVANELDINVATFAMYSKVIRRLGLLIERHAVEEAYVWRNRNHILEKISFLDNRMKRNAKVNALQFHCKNRAREFSRGCTVHLQALSAVSAEPISHQTMVIKALKNLLTRVWWYAHLELGVSRDTQLKSASAF